ncbi:MAG: adenylyltransferase/cytidyltransferase family protein [Puniceicoccales bacterium]|jgi:rfaE bifunctional protein nucleotidyltransferase chain/domain|nr:adenylyltransferase/cytidyltransferase family protein [Puniceicoccales bacterium]
MTLPELAGALPFLQLCAERERWRREGRRVVLTNGCFDLLHPGHLFLLQQAAGFGDRLAVALNSDSSVRALKGPDRPTIPQKLRAYALRALRWVDGLFLFDGTQADEEIRTFAPDVYVRANDRTLADLDSKELRALRAVGARIELVPFLPGFSTSSLLARIRGRQ